jgi:hypothetical protein
MNRVPGRRWVLGPRKRPGSRSYIARVLLRRQEGQIIPGLVMILAAIVVVGMLFLQVGRAADFSSHAQAGADAAALAAARDVKRQLEAQVAATGMSDIMTIDPIEVRAQAEVYARLNHVRITDFQREGADVRVWVTTDESLGSAAKDLGKEDQHGNARSRAVLELVGVPSLGGGGGGGGNIGPEVTGGTPTVSDKEWKKLKSEISQPPTCGTSASTNDLVTLGHLLQKHGFNVGENAEMGDVPAPNVHVAGSWHYRCNDSGALDVNHDQGDEKGAIDGLVSHLHDLGFRTIWQAEGHFDHIHIDVANSPSIGAGFGFGGSVGGLEDTLLEVKLLDWDAAAPNWLGFGGAGGAFFAGPPDMRVAGTICTVLDALHADGLVRLSAFEAAIVESGVHNLPYGDADSLGVFQQQWSQGWGSQAQIMDPTYAARQYISHAIAAERPGESAGQLAQSVQRSKYPDRYDAVRVQAATLMGQACG